MTTRFIVLPTGAAERCLLQLNELRPTDRFTRASEKSSHQDHKVADACCTPATDVSNATLVSTPEGASGFGTVSTKWIARQKSG